MLCCALWQALEGKYVEPGPGGDPIRNPAVLPTGKNIHALDPQSIPTQAALKSARVVVERYAPFLDMLDCLKISLGCNRAFCWSKGACETWCTACTRRFYSSCISGAVRSASKTA